MEDPKISVCVMTYNQEKYIRQCLQSIMDQETDFPFEVIVGDDGSTDGTAAIVREFGERYPGVVKPLLHEKNIGVTPNYLSIHNAARGEFIAHLDGDDYCLPGKLQKLAAHLEQNPGCVIVWHRMYIFNEKGESAIGMPTVPIREFVKSDRLYAKDLAKFYGMTGCHSGSMYRASAKKINYRSRGTLDYFYTLSFCIDGGYASYIDEPLGAYRFFSYEATLTKSRGNTLVGEWKLDLIRSYLDSNPELSREFAAQCLFEFLIRLYFRQPLKWDYLKLFLECRAVPSFSDLLLVTRVFNANRNKNVARRFTTTGMA